MNWRPFFIDFFDRFYSNDGAYAKTLHGFFRCALLWPAAFRGPTVRAPLLSAVAPMIQFASLPLQAGTLYSGLLGFAEFGSASRRIPSGSAPIKTARD